MYSNFWNAGGNFCNLQAKHQNNFAELTQRWKFEKLWSYLYAEPNFLVHWCRVSDANVLSLLAAALGGGKRTLFVSKVNSKIVYKSSRTRSLNWWDLSNNSFKVWKADKRISECFRLSCFIIVSKTGFKNASLCL